MRTSSVFFQELDMGQNLPSSKWLKKEARNRQGCGEVSFLE
jgi:hypothetical protein